MVLIQLVGAAVTFSVEQLIKSQYGVLGLLFLTLFGIGVKARNTACLFAGAVILLLLMAQA
jgi:hypothetical protein